MVSGRRGKSFEVKVFLRVADQCIGQVPGSGGNNVEMRSPFRMESHLRPLRDPSRASALESAPGKGARGARLPIPAISTSRKWRFSGIANRPHVIRGHRVNIKKVHGIRYFPVDRQNAIF
jgi:hypothetical protein